MNKIYEKYHLKRRLQYRIINKENFTYFKIIEYLDKYISKNKNLRILDLGCGVGTLSFYLASLGHYVDGLDISANAIDMANINKKIFNFKHTPNFINADILNYKVNNKYNLVLLSEVLEHLKEDDLIIKLAHEALLDNGYIVASSPSSNAPLFKIGLLDKFDKEVGHLRRYSLEQFVNIFELNKFQVIKTGKTEGILRNLLFTNNKFDFIVKFIKGPIKFCFSYLDELTVKLFGESNLILVAQKKLKK